MFSLNVNEKSLALGPRHKGYSVIQEKLPQTTMNEGDVKKPRASSAWGFPLIVTLCDGLICYFLVSTTGDCSAARMRSKKPRTAAYCSTGIVAARTTRVRVKIR